MGLSGILLLFLTLIFGLYTILFMRGWVKHDAAKRLRGSDLMIIGLTSVSFLAAVLVQSFTALVPFTLAMFGLIMKFHANRAVLRPKLVK
ncbi:hypothetical protein [Alteribacter natronophilus]|uniref:hypothetical protein n=1 Tax=Alteribacter natronophilus TaxID=2583810 RepID=UPI00110E6317|nr:hypothetical protein [Alteribacter natronophilus]TMW71438.1 hypothetical protein FGB90_10340 [Alteribacter natronophilus]